MILTLVMSVGLTACGGSSTSGGSDEPVAIYTHNDTKEMQAFVKGIEDNTGIDVEVLRMSSGEAWSRIQSEAPNFGADMQFGMLKGIAIKAQKKGYLASYDSPTWDDVPDKFIGPNHTWYGWSYWYDLITVNTKVLKNQGMDVPHSWKDLLDPQYKGEIVAPDPSTSGTAYLFVATILQIMGQEKGWDYLKKLAENVGQFTKTGAAPAQLVGQGEYAVGITWDQAVYNRIEKGYPMKAILPAEGTGFSLDVLWMFKGTDQPEKVKKIIDYLGTDKAMKIAAKHRSMVTKPGVKKGRTENLEEHLIDYDAQWAAKHRKEILKKWQKVIAQ